MTDEKQNPKQQSEQQPQQANNQPSGQQQDRKPIHTSQQQDSQKDQKNTEVKEKRPISLRSGKHHKRSFRGILLPGGSINLFRRFYRGALVPPFIAR